MRPPHRYILEMGTGQDFFFRVRFNPNPNPNASRWMGGNKIFKNK